MQTPSFMQTADGASFKLSVRWLTKETSNCGESRKYTTSSVTVWLWANDKCMCKFHPKKDIWQV